jgi:drug/metabolite transporter (DMT)-like permease
MLLIGTLLGLATAVIWGTGDFLSRKPSAAVGSMVTSILIQPVGLLLMILVWLGSGTTNSLQTVLAAPGYLALNLGTGLIVITGIVFLYRGYSEGIMSIVAPIAGAFPVIAVTLSIVILGVSLTLVRSVSIVAAIIGITLAGVKLSSFRQLAPSAKLPKGERQRIMKGADYGLVAMICAGFGLFNLGVVAPVIGSILSVVVLKFSETLIASAAVLSGRVKLVKPDRTTLGWIILIGASDATGFATYNLAVTSAGGSLPVVVTLAGMIGVVTIILARVFYKERLEKIQLLGVVIIFAAVAAILYF